MDEVQQRVLSFGAAVATLALLSPFPVDARKLYDDDPLRVAKPLPVKDGHRRRTSDRLDFFKTTFRKQVSTSHPLTRLGFRVLDSGKLHRPCFAGEAEVAPGTKFQDSRGHERELLVEDIGHHA